MKNILFTACLFLCASFTSGQTFTLSSADLGGQFTNEFIAANFGCTGSNKSPELHWTNAPAGTKSFAVTMYDADAPTGSGFWHWVLVDIPSNVMQLKSGAGSIPQKLAPDGSLQSLNDTGAPGYQGPCPPEGETAHRYIITVYALNTPKLGTSSQSTAALTGFMLHSATIARASLIVYCKR
ncbi:YbhB/YbcL family Raf kinase inhibitor-like protein [Pararcticibacter amylolyticus]|uniref:YbhB/YbcL family Raf kinase inhibitor-like protein n=1 Tax=Pararcticibacter amylolyticus TaxID=2173175 RepID=A0A2U2PCW5_9SPHI|nr:YbhB/YbcL family Raf kinase inhibitor-like protein [Pararcticibacter amylolyticus]PWG79238.1 YbhB/YbcL family Raf kinase inhibitor-like protein [Pararcticibacter amylolyticus]